MTTRKRPTTIAKYINVSADSVLKSCDMLLLPHVVPSMYFRFDIYTSWGIPFQGARARKQLKHLWLEAGKKKRKTFLSSPHPRQRLHAGRAWKCSRHTRSTCGVSTKTSSRATTFPLRRLFVFPSWTQDSWQHTAMNHLSKTLQIYFYFGIQGFRPTKRIWASGRDSCHAPDQKHQGK